jgi:hypothetical protein
MIHRVDKLISRELELVNEMEVLCSCCAHRIIMWIILKLSFPCLTEVLWITFVANVLSRVWGSVTNNNGFWIGWLDLLTPSFSITTTHNWWLPKACSIPYWTTNVFLVILLLWLRSGLWIGHFFSFHCPLVNTPQLNTEPNSTIGPPSEFSSNWLATELTNYVSSLYNLGMNWIEITISNSSRYCVLIYYCGNVSCDPLPSNKCPSTVDTVTLGTCLLNCCLAMVICITISWDLFTRISSPWYQILIVRLLFQGGICQPLQYYQETFLSGLSAVMKMKCPTFSTLLVIIYLAFLYEGSNMFFSIICQPFLYVCEGGCTNAHWVVDLTVLNLQRTKFISFHICARCYNGPHDEICFVSFAWKWWSTSNGMEKKLEYWMNNECQCSAICLWWHWYYYEALALTRGLRHELSSPTWTLGLWVQIPLKAWIFVCVCSVLV